MPRYYLHILKGETLERDEVGIEIQDGNPLEEEVLEAARDLLADGDRQGIDRREWIFDVTDEAGTVVHSLLLGEAVELEEPRSQGEDDPEATKAHPGDVIP